MKVKELIKALSVLDPEMIVKVQDGGICSAWEPIGDIDTYNREETFVRLWGF